MKNPHVLRFTSLLLLAFASVAVAAGMVLAQTENAPLADAPLAEASDVTEPDVSESAEPTNEPTNDPADAPTTEPAEPKPQAKEVLPSTNTGDMSADTQPQPPVDTQPADPGVEGAVPTAPNATEPSPTEPSPSEPSPSDQEFRDPTVPSAEMLRLMQRGEATTTQLPPIPAVAIKGIVLASPDRGVAMLEVDGRSFSVQLLAKKDQRMLTLSAGEVADSNVVFNGESPSTLDQNSPESLDSYQLSLESSFASGGVLFNIEEFSSSSLLLRVIPHRQYILVRN